MPTDITVQEAYALNPRGQVRGNPTVYRKHFPALVRKIASMTLGVTDCELALGLGISKRAMYNLMQTHKDFGEAIYQARTKSEADLIKRVRDAESKTLDVHGMFLLKAIHGLRDRGEEPRGSDIANGGVLRIEVVHRLLQEPSGSARALGQKRPGAAGAGSHRDQVTDSIDVAFEAVKDE